MIMLRQRDPVRRPVPPAGPGVPGVLAFSTTAFLLGVHNAGLGGAIGAGPVLLVAVVVGGFVQATLAVHEVFRGSGLAATALAGSGPFWIAHGLAGSLPAARVPDLAGTATLTSGSTVFLGLFTVLAVVVLVACLRTDVVLVTVSGLLVVALVLLVVGVGSAHPGPVRASGHLMLALGVLGWYRGAAGALGFLAGRPVLPTGSLARLPA